MDLLWLLFAFLALQPAVQKHLILAARQRQLARLEKLRGTRVILLVHRQESMSLLGFPLVRYIDIDDSEAILRALDLTDPDVPVDLVLHTPGGLVLAATQIARAIRRRPGKVTAVIPHYAMSGGTLIALACHEILMSPNAVLGPVDPQVGQYPAGSLLKVVREKPIAEIDDETLILADQAEKAVAQVREVVKELLADKYPPERADELARMASEGRWTHDRPITYDEIKGLGHPVSDQLPKEFLELMTLYPQPVRATPSVEYLKRPRHRDAGGPQLSG